MRMREDTLVSKSVAAAAGRSARVWMSALRRMRLPREWRELARALVRDCAPPAAMGQPVVCPAATKTIPVLSLIHISEPTRLGMISYPVFCLKKKITLGVRQFDASAAVRNMSHHAATV